MTELHGLNTFHIICFKQTLFYNMQIKDILLKKIFEAYVIWKGYYAPGNRGKMGVFYEKGESSHHKLA